MLLLASVHTKKTTDTTAETACTQQWVEPKRQHVFGRCDIDELGPDELTAALALSRVVGDQEGECARLGSLGIAHSCLGKSTAAIRFYTAALTLSRRLGLPSSATHFANLTPEQIVEKIGGKVAKWIAGMKRDTAKEQKKLSDYVADLQRQGVIAQEEVAKAQKAEKEAEEAKQRQAEAEGMEQAWSTLEERLGLSSASAAEQSLRVELAEKDEALAEQAGAIAEQAGTIAEQSAELARLRAKYEPAEGVPRAASPAK